MLHRRIMLTVWCWRGLGLGTNEQTTAVEAISPSNERTSTKREDDAIFHDLSRAWETRLCLYGSWGTSSISQFLQGGAPQLTTDITPINPPESVHPTFHQPNLRQVQSLRWPPHTVPGRGHATVGPRGTRPVSSGGSQGVLRSQPFGRRQTRTVSSTVSQAVPSPMPQGPGCCNLLRSTTGSHVNRTFFANKNLLEACPCI